MTGTGDDRPLSVAEAEGDIAQRLPGWFWEVPYVGSRYPGAVPRATLRQGANCQLWAYELLANYGFFVPDFRSDELWRDTAATELVDEPRPLDLILFNAVADPWGAHVGIWVGDGTVAHLSREVGYPALWDLGEFVARERYRMVVGFKRPTRRRAACDAKNAGAGEPPPDSPHSLGR